MPARLLKSPKVSVLMPFPAESQPPFHAANAGVSAGTSDFVSLPPFLLGLGDSSSMFPWWEPRAPATVTNQAALSPLHRGVAFAMVWALPGTPPPPPMAEKP